MHHSAADDRISGQHRMRLPGVMKRMLHKLSSPGPGKQALHAVAPVAADDAPVSESIPALRQALAWHPASLPHRLRLGEACLATGRHADAIDAFSHALRLDLKNEHAAAGLAHALSSAGRFIDAAQVCFDSLAHHPHSRLLHEALAAALARAGLATQAETVWRHAQLPGDPVRHRLQTCLPSAAVTPDPELAAHWREVLAPWEGIRIGLAWFDTSNDAPERSLPLAEFAALAGMPGITFFALQASREAHYPPEGIEWVALAEAFRAPADPAAALAGLDAVITVDAGIAAQAVAAGCRTWLLLPEHADWSGPAEVRVLRQARRGEWTPVLQMLAQELYSLLDHEEIRPRLHPMQRALRQAEMAMLHHRYTDAEQIYRAVLDEPAALTPPALFALRQYTVRTGRHSLFDGIERHRNRVSDEVMDELDDMRAAALLHKGEQDAAFAVWDRLIAGRFPALRVFLHYGEALHRACLWERAVAVWEKAFALHPDAPALLLAAAYSYRDHGRIERAIECLRRALTLSPHHADGHLTLGVLLRQQQQLEEARRHLQAGLRIAPCNSRGWDELGHLLYGKEGRARVAAICFKRSLELLPAQYASTQLGYCHYNLREYEEAVEMLGRALRFAPQDRDALYYKAASLQYLVRYPEAIEFYEKAAELDRASGRTDTSLHRQLSTLYLTLEMFDKGYAAAALSWERRELSRPRWKGEPLEGKTLLVYQGHGFGDTIQYVRLLRLLKPAKVIYAVAQPLLRLFKGIDGIDELHSLYDVDLEKLDYDYHINEYGLVCALRIDPHRNPVEMPYLKADAELAAFWREKMADDRNMKVGIVWSGNPAHGFDSDRSSNLADWLPLAGVPNVTLYNLQKNARTDELFDYPQLHVVDYSKVFNDFADVAAIISSLDLVISIDSSPVHLAGALGKPVWNLLGWRGVDWRWLKERTDCPWYPGVRLFRQAKGQSWHDVLTQVAGELAKQAGGFAKG